MDKKRLLVIEDDTAIAELIRLAAEEVGFTAYTATDGKMIDTLCLDLQPDVIVLDVIMPEQDGFEVIQLLSENYYSTPVLILSGHDDYREMAERIGSAIGINVIGKIAKPFRKDDLCERLRLVQMMLTGQKELPLNKRMVQ